MIRPRTVLLVGGVVAVLGIVTYLAASMMGTLYVTACQSGAEWSNSPGCRKILLQTWAGIGLTAIGVGLVGYGLFLRLIERRRARN